MFQSVFINGAHALLAVSGFAFIAAIARTRAGNTWLWPSTLLLCALSAGFLFLVSDPGSIFEDFRKAYHPAGLANLNRKDIDTLFESNVFGFVNLPIISAAFTPLALMPDNWSAVVYSLLAGAALLWAWWLTVRDLAFDRVQQALSLFAMSGFGPLIHSLRQANMTHLALATVIFGVFSIKRGRSLLAGATFGVAAMIKPPLALLGLWLLLRAQWKAAAAMAVTGLTLTCLSVLVYGIDVHLNWFEHCIEPFLTGVVGAFNAQSIPAFFARLELGPEVLLDWAPHPVSLSTRIVQYATSLVLVGMAVWAAMRGSRPQFDFEVALVLALAFLLSSLSWSHYAVWLLPAMAWVFVESGPDAPARGLRPALIAAFVMTAPAEFLSPAMRDGVYPLSLLLTSHLVIGGLFTVGILISARLRVAGLAVPPEENALVWRRASS